MAKSFLKMSAEPKETPKATVSEAFGVKDITVVCNAAAKAYCESNKMKKREVTEEDVRDRIETPTPHDQYIKPGLSTKEFLLEKVICMTVDYLKVLL